MGRPRNPNRKRRPYRPRKKWTPVQQVDMFQAFRDEFGENPRLYRIAIQDIRETAKAREASQGGQSPA